MVAGDVKHGTTPAFHPKGVEMGTVILIITPNNRIGKTAFKHYGHKEYHTTSQDLHLHFLVETTAVLLLSPMVNLPFPCPFVVRCWLPTQQ